MIRRKSFETAYRIAFVRVHQNREEFSRESFSNAHEVRAGSHVDVTVVASSGNTLPERASMSVTLK